MKNKIDFRIIAALLALSLLIGGAGLSFPGLGLLLQLSALLVGAYFIVTPRTWRFPLLSRLALGLLAAIVVLPMLQLVPLPPAIWTELPGRTLPTQLDALLRAPRWRPLTLDVEGTLRSLVTLLPAAVIFAGSLFLPRSQRAKLLWVVLACAMISALLGIIQVATGGWLTPYISGHFGDSTGLFVNRNHNAAFLLTAMPIAAALAATQFADGKPQAPWIAASLSAIVVLAIGVLGTTSRMGLLLLPVAVAASLALLAYGRARWRLVLTSAAGVAAVATALIASSRFDRILARFSGLDNPRIDYWTDIQWALEHYGLIGTGFGTFVPVYKSAESLEAVVPKLTNHAHNDYLEILLEGGLPAVLLFVLFLILMTVSAYRAVRTQSRPAQLLAIGAAVIGILVLLAASVVDYPLRMPALSAVLALLCAIVLPSRRDAASSNASAPPRVYGPGVRRVSLAAGLAVVAALLVVVVQAGLSAYYVRAGRAEAALRWAGWATQAHERLATQALIRNQRREALSHGYAAIGLSPISAPAIRSIGFVRLAEGRVGQGTSLMQLAVILGWRDSLTQMWAIEAARISQEPDKALQRAEAVFRRNVRAAPVIAQILNFPPESKILPLLAQKLSRRPEWRDAFFDASGHLPPETTDAWLKLVALLDRTEAPVSGREGQPSLDALLAKGRIEQAQRLWAMLQDGDRLIRNGDFQAVDQRRGTTAPADWHVSANNRSSVRVEAPTAGSPERAIRIRAAKGGTILQQTLMLRPGTYAFAFRARVEGSTAQTLRWDFRCVGSGPHQQREAIIPPALRWHENRAVFTVPIRHCSIQRLALSSSAAIPLNDVWIDSVRLSSAPR